MPDANRPPAQPAAGHLAATQPPTTFDPAVRALLAPDAVALIALSACEFTLTEIAILLYRGQDEVREMIAALLRLTGLATFADLVELARLQDGWIEHPRARSTAFDDSPQAQAARRTQLLDAIDGPGAGATRRAAERRPAGTWSPSAAPGAKTWLAVCGYLAAANGPRTVPQIAAALGAPRSAVAKALQSSDGRAVALDSRWMLALRVRAARRAGRPAEGCAGVAHTTRAGFGHGQGAALRSAGQTARVRPCGCRRHGRAARPCRDGRD